MPWLPLILNGNKALFCLCEELYFICVTLFDLGLVLKFQFSLVIYIYIRLYLRFVI